MLFETHLKYINKEKITNHICNNYRSSAISDFEVHVKSQLQN